MMGVLANTVMKYGGKVIGITTQHLLKKEVPFDTLLENGKPTCQIGKALQVLQVLGIQLNLSHTELENEKL